MARMFRREDHLIIVHNKVKCLQCNKEIESLDRHDYRTCGCPNQTMVDGGKDYLRRGGVDFSKIQDMSEKSMPDCLCGHTWEDHHHGCVMNLAYEHYPLNFRGCIAQECEATQVNGDWLVDNVEERCYCSGYDCSNLEIAKAAKQFQNDEHMKRDLEEVEDGNGECEVKQEAASGASEVTPQTTDVEGNERSNARTLTKDWAGESQGD